MSKDPWLLELEQERASPAVAEGFAMSARQLAAGLSRNDEDAIEQTYRRPHESALPADPLAAAVARGGLLGEDHAARQLLDYATGVHRDPLRAIAAQTLLHGSHQDQRFAVVILEDLAITSRYAEAAVTLFVWSHVLSNQDRNRWHEFAASLWAPSVSGLGPKVGRLMHFSSYYVAHVLASYRGMKSTD